MPKGRRAAKGACDRSGRRQRRFGWLLGCGAKPGVPHTPSVRLSQSISGRVSQSGNGEPQSPASRADRLTAVAVDVVDTPKAL